MQSYANIYCGKYYCQESFQVKHQKAHIYACKADLPGQKEEEARAQSADGRVFKIVPWHHLEHSTSNSLSIQALSHDLTGLDR